MTDINLPAVLVSDGVASVLALTVLCSRFRKPRIKSFDDTIFFLMTLLVAFLPVLEGITFVLDGVVFPGAIVLSVILNVALFVLTFVVTVLWALYTDYKLFESTEHIKKFLPYAVLPLVVPVVLCLCNLFYPIFFHINDTVEYVRRPLLPFLFLVNYLYIVAMSLRIVYFRKKIGKYIFVPTVMFLIPIFIGSVLQVIFYGFSFMWVGIALGLNSLYINLQNETNYTDPLTKLYNRTYLLSYLKNRWNKGHAFVGLMLDLNSFKQINDTYGHLEGDEALKAAGKILLESVEDHCIVARYAGDEFIIIKEGPYVACAENIYENIQNNVCRFNEESNKPYELSFSIGICRNSNQPLDKFLNFMDLAMYQEKSRYYEEGCHNRRVR